MRNIPDVALTADYIWVNYGDGTNGSFMGTSSAAPLWAGFTALVNEQAVTEGLPPVGFLNPALYAIGQSTLYTNAFHDTTVGSNAWSLSQDNYFAAPGYDLCTGWGTLNG
jgi:subtilase family serine protease